MASMSSPIRQRLMTLAWPIIIQFYLFQLTAVVDNLMVGQFGEQTIAALGICLQLNFLVVLLCRVNRGRRGDHRPIAGRP